MLSRLFCVFYAAEAVPDSEETKAQAEKISGKLEAGDKVSNFMAGQLVELINKDNPEFMKNTWPTLAEEIDRREEAAEKEKAVSEDTDSTAVNDNPAEHTAEQQRIIEEYKNAVDEGLKKAFEEYSENPNGKFMRYDISSVSDKQAADMAAIIDGDYSGYTNAINTNGIKHILNEHGPHGTTNHSMSDLNDAARIKYVLDNYDNVQQATYASGDVKYSNEFRDSNNKPAQMVVFSKKINGTYFVVEAAPDTKYKKLWVVSAYIDKKGGFTQASDAQGPENTSDTSLASQSPTTTVTQETKESNSGKKKSLRELYKDGKELTRAKKRNEVNENVRENIQDSERSSERSRENEEKRRADAGDAEGVQTHDGEKLRGDTVSGRVYTAGDGQRDAGGLRQQDTAVNRQNSVNAYGVEAISSREAGLKKGSVSETVFEIPEELYDEELKIIAADAEENGLEIHMYTGLMALKNGKTVDGYHKDGVVWIKADSHRRTATEAYDHEKFHMAVGRNKQAFAAVAKWLKSIGGERLERIIARYTERYGNSYDLDSMSDEEAAYTIIEEIMADAYAGADVFKEGVTEYTEAARAAADELGATKNSEYNENQGRAPPQGMTYEDVKNAVREVISEITGNKSGTQTQESMEKYAQTDEEEDYDAPITEKDIDTIRSIGRKSINDFTSEDIKKAEKWAYKFYQELGTKSPFFRAWFGDWRANDTAAVEITDIPVYDKSMLKKQRGTVWCKDARTDVQIQDGWEIGISGNGERNTMSHAGNEKRSVYALSNIRGLIENAVFLDTEVHEHHANNRPNEKIAFDHKLYSLGMDTSGNTGLYKITVEEIFQSKSEPNKRRFHNLKYIEKVADIPGGRTFSQRNSGGSADGGISTTDYTVSDLFELVKKYDGEFNPKSVNPVLLNEDGTPRVFYHQTENEFTRFDTTRQTNSASDSETPNGIFLKSTDKDIGIMGSVQMPLYATAENTLKFKNREEANRWYQKNIVGYAEIQWEIEETDRVYDERYTKQEEKCDQFYEEHYDDVISGRMSEEEFQRGSEEGLDEILAEWKAETNSLRSEARELLDEYFENSEYDSMYFEYDAGSHGRETDALIIFDEGNVKSSTDNIGTFDSGDADIRYAIAGDESTDREEIDAVQSIGRKSINDFTSADIKATERYARQYFREMGTKSPFFRAWFGDWRANDTTPISVARTQGNVREKIRNEDTGWKINVSSKVFNETKSHTNSYNKAARPYLAYINDIIKNAVLLDSWGIGKAKSENSLLMHSMYAVADIGNGPEIMKLYVEEMNDPNSKSTAKRAYQLQNIEISSPTGAKDTISSGQALASLQTADAETVSDLFELVKSNDSKFNPKPVNLVLLNENGTPRVLYHGTDSKFTEFKASEFGLREGSYFFAQNYEDAAAYTASGNVMEVYVSLKNPIDYNDMPHEIYKLRDKRAQVEALKELGYDGWYADMDTGWGEVSAFYPEQIKSATDNIGTFNSDDGDIRYAISPDLEDELDAVLDGSFNARNNEVVVGTTSDFLVNELGADVLSNTMPARKAYAAMVSEERAKADGRYDSKLNYHELGIEGLYNALKSAEKPIAAIAAAADEKGNKRFDRIVLVTDQKENGNNIVVVNEVNAAGYIRGKRIKVNKTITAFDNASVYTAIRKAAEDGRLLYLDKKRSQNISAAPSSGLESDLRNVDFKANIDAFWANVKWKKSGAAEYYSGTPGNTAMQDAFEKAFKENAGNEKYALSEEEREEMENTPPEQRLWEDTANRSIHTYGYTHPELRPYYESAARLMYLDATGSLKGMRWGIKDSEGYYVGSTGQKRSTTDSIANLLDNGGMTYERIATAAQVIANGKWIEEQHKRADVKKVEY